MSESGTITNPDRSGSLRNQLRENPRWLELGLSLIAVSLAAYMFYATIFGPYRTTLVHRAIFLGPILLIYFLSSCRSGNGVKRWGDIVLAVVGVLTTAFVVFNYEHISNLIGASLLSPTDLLVGGLLIVITLEAARRQSVIFCLIAVIAIIYTIYGPYFPGMFRHPGIDLKRFIFLNAYGPEGIFGVGLAVATNYLFMFILLGVTLQASGTSKFVIDVADAAVGHLAGGPGKVSLVASAGLGTMVGSSIGNVVTTGAITIPLMKQAGFKPHVAAAIEVLNSEGAQLIPPVMGAGAFIMAELTGIPYATIAIAAIIPSVLYYLSAYLIIHLEAKKNGLHGRKNSAVPIWISIKRGWHLTLPIIALFYMLISVRLTVSYAGMISVVVAIAVAQMRPHTRMSWKTIFGVFDNGVRSAVKITGLIAALGLIQQGLTITGLGGRFSEIMMAISGGSPLGTAAIVVAVTVILGMGMPTPIAYVIAAIFVGPSLVDAGFPILAANMFIFFFAIKSGSTPPVAVVAVVAAGIAEADWWRTGWLAFWYSIPGWAVAFAFLITPALLLQERSGLITVLNLLSATLGVVGITAGVAGYAIGVLRAHERLLLSIGAILLIFSSILSSLVGITVMSLGLALHVRRTRRCMAKLEEPTTSAGETHKGHDARIRKQSENV
ncbi:MAG: TRAP transporter fused permease subunit [Alphaproteobacteria bacterium]|nr:TRAP transporter fused permease subunit [Alphaproteobacteria bacterium]